MLRERFIRVVWIFWDLCKKTCKILYSEHGANRPDCICALQLWWVASLETTSTNKWRWWLRNRWDHRSGFPPTSRCSRQLCTLWRTSFSSEHLQCRSLLTDFLPSCLVCFLPSLVNCNAVYLGLSTSDQLNWTFELNNLCRASLHCTIDHNQQEWHTCLLALSTLK